MGGRESAQSSRCGLDLGARRSGGPGEAGLRANPAPFPATAWGCERSVPVVHPWFISTGLWSWDRIRARCRPLLTGTAPDAAMPCPGASSASQRGPLSFLSAWARAPARSLGRPHFEVTPHLWAPAFLPFWVRLRRPVGFSSYLSLQMGKLRPR